MGHDPWAHRRGEPRLFAFCWTCYVLLAVAGSLSWVARATSVTSDSYSPAGRIMLVVVAVGMVLLWPMTRLSQVSPDRNTLGAVWTDLLLIQLPVQIVTWPMMVLGNWPRDIVLGVSALLGGWGVLTSGLIAGALVGPGIQNPRDRRLIQRTLWMIAAVLVLGTAPVVQAIVLARGEAPPVWLKMGSPLTAIPAMTGRGLVGPSSPISAIQWEAIGATWVLGGLLWLAALVRSLLARWRRAA